MGMWWWLATLPLPRCMARSIISKDALASPSSCSCYRQHLFCHLLRFSCAATTPSNPRPAALQLLPYFSNPSSSHSCHCHRCLLSTSAAAAATTHGPSSATVYKGLHRKSPRNPDAVALCLERQGLSRADISRMLRCHPRLLSASVENTLEPGIRELLGAGFSMPGLGRLSASAPGALLSSKALPRIGFWRALLGNDEKRLLRVLKRNRNIIALDIARNISPRIALLRRRSLSDGLIAYAVERIDIICRRVDFVEEKLWQAEEMGFRPTSGMFVQGLHLVTYATRDSLEEKMRLMASYGWTEKEFRSTLHRGPTFA